MGDGITIPSMISKEEGVLIAKMIIQFNKIEIQIIGTIPDAKTELVG